MQCDVITFSRIQATDTGMHRPGLVIIAPVDSLPASLLLSLPFFPLWKDVMVECPSIVSCRRHMPACCLHSYRLANYLGTRPYKDRAVGFPDYVLQPMKTPCVTGAYAGHRYAVIGLQELYNSGGAVIGLHAHRAAVTCTLIGGGVSFGAAE
jgi:hypothetical protein